ncbi:MAG: hypothetical protein NXI19_13695 [Alphaproteobacteria bacterium]|nr:hypothetical protein [Alphaproteobacteria bacterium]
MGEDVVRKDTIKAIAVLMPLAVSISACGNLDSSNLVFGQSDSVGLKIAGSGPQQNAELSLGYNSDNVAIVPAATRDENGNLTIISSSINGAGQDALSTFGSFALNTGDNTIVSVGLGKFFATGSAAQTLAQGFADYGLRAAPKDSVIIPQITE